MTWSEDFSVQVNRLALRYIDTFFETPLVIPNVFIVFLHQFQTSSLLTNIFFLIPG